MASGSTLSTSAPIPVRRPTAQPIWGAWGLRLTAFSYLAVLVLIPLLVVGIAGFREGFADFWEHLTRPAALYSVWLSVWTAALMTVINTLIGGLTAYALVAYRFPGKALFNTLIDLPFAIPSLVTGVMLALLYGPQTGLGKFMEKEMGLRIIYNTPGIVIALLFIGYPFIIRAVQPVLLEMELHHEQAAHTLGASGWQTFWRIIFPAIRPALIMGASLSFARALGEFGAVALVAGNMPMKTQTAATYIYAQVEGDNLPAASAVSFVLLLIAFGVTFGADYFLRKQARTKHA